MDRPATAQVGGSGTPGTVPVWTGDGTVLSDSHIQDNGATVNVALLVSGDVGTVVHVYADGKAFEIEFMTLDGQTAAVATVEASAVRPVTGRDISHSRHVQSS